jgi:hypothetical protein
MSDTGSPEYEEQYAQYRQQSKQEFDQYFNDFERTVQQGSLEDITQWKDLFQQLGQGYGEAAQADPKEDKRQSWQTAADNTLFAAQTLSAINDIDHSGLSDALNSAQESIRNVSNEQDGESEEQKTTLRDHRAKASETHSQLDQMKNQASDIKRVNRQDVERMRNDMRDMHQNTQSVGSEHRNADEQAGQHYDTAVQHMDNANQWGDQVGGCFEQSDGAVDALRAAGEALGQVAAN